MHTVIIVDDDKWAIEDIKQSFRFEAWSFTIIGEYLHAEDALTAIQEKKPDLVISDIKMNKMSGLDMIEACRTAGVDSKFVLVSGYDSFEYVQKAFLNKVYFYLLKPLNDDDVVHLMERLTKELADENIDPSVILNLPEKKGSFERAIEYINAHFTEPLSLSDVADKAYINKAYLSQMISTRLGKTFTYYKNELRIDYAKRLIRAGKITSFTDIAQLSGFDSSSQFSKTFRQHEGMTPQEYKKTSGNDGK